VFCHADTQGYLQVLPGIRRKTLAHGDKTLVAEFRMEKGSTLPRHAHPHEQSGYVVSGRIRVSIGEEVINAGPGDSWSILGNVQHAVEVLEQTVVIEVFSPVREDYLPAKATSDVHRAS
jgi:quercetin dioxygenase-like cupin family protein